jgi:hypothetical protein
LTRTLSKRGESNFMTKHYALLLRIPSRLDNRAAHLIPPQSGH